MGLIDSHAHLTYPELFGQIDGVLQRCETAGVERVITVGTDRADALAAVALAERFPGRVEAAAGIHPHHAGEAIDADLRVMSGLWHSKRLVAVGEIGLDYHYDFADRGVQRAIFARQLELAAGLPYPLIIHCRDAFDDTCRLLQEHEFAGRRVVFHCFTGTEEEAARVAACGWRLSFTGIVTFRNSRSLQAIAREYPGDQLMVETDSPFLSPEPVRGRKPNEPAHVVHIVRSLAALRSVSYEELARQTEENTRRFFGISEGPLANP